MSERIYFLVKDEDQAQQIVDDLRSAGVAEDDLQAVAHRDRYPIEGVPEGGITERTDILPAARRGLAVGGTTGFLAGLAAVALPTPAIVLAGGAMVGTLTAAGAAVGTWAATLVGIGITHRDLKPFEEAMEAGRVLILVNVESDQRGDIEKRVLAHDANIVIESGDLADAD